MSEQRMPGGVPELTLGWRMKMALGHNVTVQQMADELGMSRGQVSRYLNDKGVPRRAVLVTWALRCGVPFEWLAYGRLPGPSPDDGGSTLDESGSACTRSAQVIAMPRSLLGNTPEDRRRVA